MKEINLTDSDSFIVANYNGVESFTLQMNNIGPVEVANLIGHLAVLLETREGITIEETATNLLNNQGDFVQKTE